LPNVPAVRTTTPRAWHAAAIRPVTDVADDADAVLEGAQPGQHDVADRARLRGEVQLAHRLDGAEGGGAGDRVAAEGSAEPAGVDGVHVLGAPGDGAQRKPAGDALGGGDEVRDDVLVLAGEPVPRRRKPVWISSATSSAPAVWHQS